MNDLYYSKSNYTILVTQRHFTEFMLVSRDIICTNCQANLIKNLDKAIKVIIEMICKNVRIRVPFKVVYV